MKAKGSDGGHNGLGNIQEVLNSNEYSRLRFGVGSDFAKGRQVDYVLSNFPKEELNLLPEYLDKACEGILSFCTVGIERTMTAVNGK
jgi:peptidyl-tRNA hydrolase, PTH1 family